MFDCRNARRNFSQKLHLKPKEKRLISRLALFRKSRDGCLFLGTAAFSEHHGLKHELCSSYLLLGPFGLAQ